MFIVVFVYAYVKNTRLRLGEKLVRLDILAIIGFLAAITAGYILQPWIGNISGDERDFGALIFLWSTIGMILVGALAAMRKPVAIERPLEVET